MNPFFNTDTRIASLAECARAWTGTPWCANSEARGPGGGVSCHNLPRAIYVQCGALRPDFPRVKADPNSSRHTRSSVMEPFLDRRPEFRRLPQAESLRPGDLLGLRIFHCVDHLALLLPNNVFIHVLMHKKTDLDLITQHPWQQRLTAAWRPMDTAI